MQLRLESFCLIKQYNHITVQLKKCIRLGRVNFIHGRYTYICEYKKEYTGKYQYSVLFGKHANILAAHNLKSDIRCKRMWPKVVLHYGYSRTSSNRTPRDRRKLIDFTDIRFIRYDFQRKYRGSDRKICLSNKTV